jgi:hypothetical protein
MVEEPAPVRRTTLLLLVLLMACSGGGGDGGRASPDGDVAASRADGEVVADHDDERQLSVVARDGDLVLIDGEGVRTPLVSLDDPAYGIEHVALRPGQHESVTVVALTSAEDRYELRYLVVDADEGPSDLYAFPWRMQVDQDLSVAADTAPRPVWAPDGSAVAWLEWDEDGTRLRTVGWIDHGRASNPSDELAAYTVHEVPAGAQLQRWEDSRAGSTFVAHDGEVEWHIELGSEDRAVAMTVE